MELYPGTKIPQNELQTLKCNQKWNAIRKSYAEFVGKPYVIPPVYREDKKNKTEKNNNGKNITRKNITYRRH